MSPRDYNLLSMRVILGKTNGLNRSYVNMALKIHIIIHHYPFYFSKTGKNFKDTNGEFGETCHSTLKMFEKQKGF